MAAIAAIAPQSTAALQLLDLAAIPDPDPAATAIAAIAIAVTAPHASAASHRDPTLSCLNRRLFCEEPLTEYYKPQVLGGETRGRDPRDPRVDPQS